MYQAWPHSVLAEGSQMIAWKCGPVPWPLAASSVFPCFGGLHSMGASLVDRMRGILGI